MLSDAQVERYSRQVVLPEVGGRGQQALIDSAVAIAGSGPIARTAALYLAAAGVGRIDLYSSEADASLRADLVDLNPDVAVNERQWPASGRIGCDLLLVAGGQANLLRTCNGAALDAGITLGVGAVHGTRGFAGTFRGHLNGLPCGECWLTSMGDAPESGPPTPLESALDSLVGSLLAAEAIRSRLGTGGDPVGTVLRYDAGDVTTERVSVARLEACGACGRLAVNAC